MIHGGEEEGPWPISNAQQNDGVVRGSDSSSPASGFGIEFIEQPQRGMFVMDVGLGDGAVVEVSDEAGLLVRTVLAGDGMRRIVLPLDRPCYGGVKVQLVSAPSGFRLYNFSFTR